MNQLESSKSPVAVLKLLGIREVLRILRQAVREKLVKPRLMLEKSDSAGREI